MLLMAVPRRASASWLLSAGRNRRFRFAGASGAGRCQSIDFPRPRAGDGATLSSTDVRSRQRRRQVHHAAALPPYRRERSCRRRPPHRSPDPGQDPLGRALARTDPTWSRTKEPCLCCVRLFLPQRALPPRHQPRHCRHRRPREAHRWLGHRPEGASPPRLSRTGAPFSRVVSGLRFGRFERVATVWRTWTARSLWEPPARYSVMFTICSTFPIEESSIASVFPLLGSALAMQTFA